jgi:hypothetical protein
MTTAMTPDCYTGLVRAVGMLLSVIVSSEFIYFLLFSETPDEARENYVFNPSYSKLLFSGVSNHAKENSVCNPYRFKKAKLIAQALSFIFFMHPRCVRFAISTCKNHSSSGNHFSNSGNNDSSTSGNRFSISGNNYSYIYPGNDQSFTWRRNNVTRKVFADRAMQNITTCL